jgi:hypothetical protein
LYESESTVSFFLLRIFPHLIGEKTARIPKKQKNVKTKPITGFRQLKSSMIVGGKTVKVATRSKPAIDARI